MIGTIRQVIEQDFMLMGRSYSITTICTTAMAGWAHECKIMKMAYLLAKMVELTSETWCELVNSQATHHVVLYRIKIRNDLT